MTQFDIKAATDDDTHTIASGALTRLLRMRKWMLLVGVLLVLIRGGWWNDEPMRRAAGLEALPREAIWFAASAFGLYLLISGGVMLIQYWVLEDVERRNRVDAALATLRARHEKNLEEVAEMDALRADWERMQAGQKSPAPRRWNTDIALRVIKMRRFYLDATNYMSTRLTHSAEWIIDTIRVLPPYVFLSWAMLVGSNFQFRESLQSLAVKPTQETQQLRGVQASAIAEPLPCGLTDRAGEACTCAHP